MWRSRRNTGASIERSSSASASRDITPTSRIGRPDASRTAVASAQPSRIVPAVVSSIRCVLTAMPVTRQREAASIARRMSRHP
jgi:hypothetical protein